MPPVWVGAGLLQPHRRVLASCRAVAPLHLGKGPNGAGGRPDTLGSDLAAQPCSTSHSQASDSVCSAVKWAQDSRRCLKSYCREQTRQCCGVGAPRLTGADPLRTPGPPPCVTHCSGSTCGWQCALGWAGGGEPANPHFTDSEKRPRECRTQAHSRSGQAPSHRRLSRVTLLPQSKFLTRTEPTRDPRGRIPEALVPGEKQEQEDRGRERDNERRRPSRTGTEGWWRRGWGPPRRHQSGQRDRQSSGQR